MIEAEASFMNGRCNKYSMLLAEAKILSGIREAIETWRHEAKLCGHVLPPHAKLGQRCEQHTRIGTKPPVCARRYTYQRL